jgi:hypothetical protein
VTSSTKTENKTVTILYVQFVEDGSLFCIFSLLKAVTILYFQFVEGGHYFVFSICLKTVTMLYFQFVEGGQPKTQNSDSLQQTENTK